MTELEYVHLLRSAAADYISVVGRGPGEPIQIGDKAKVDRWGILRGQMSTSTFIAMADAWLEKNK